MKLRANESTKPTLYTLYYSIEVLLTTIATCIIVGTMKSTLLNTTRNFHFS